MSHEHVDFFYSLDGYGWSTCYIFVGSEVFYMGPTHIFGHPLSALLSAFCEILNGEPFVTFKWQDEPGEYKWTIERDKKKQHIVKITITECVKLSFAFQAVVETLVFDVKIKMFCLCIFYQMEKLRSLMTERSYQKARGTDFPDADFKEFKSLLLKKYAFYTRP